ncbi:MAG: hypothetical protein JW747_09510 [Candidatus Aminicenantes bacterium]|nr:hypothetical protein [Candidatus Aminicenantes bacterium]
MKSMCVAVEEMEGDVRIYGSGSPGGKGEGLIRINRLTLPKVRRLATRILSAEFYELFLKDAEAFRASARAVVRSILKEFGEIPIGVRSSATNESGRKSGKADSVHAGENATFMLPNNHPDPEVRLSQAVLAVAHIYEDFRRKQPPGSQEKMGIVLNPVPGIFDDTMAGPVYYPYISGVASSFFPHALKNQNPWEGFARIAFGHGYAAVLDDFPVISMATIRNPIPIDLLRIGKGQEYFYALDMTRNAELKGEELETMKKLHVRFANFHKIRMLGIQHNLITIEELVQKDHFAFRTNLVEIMETISRRIARHFQIEFVFNVDFSRKSDRESAFHIVQLTELPELDYHALSAPGNIRRNYLDISNSQGHGIAANIERAVAVSPFLYSPEKQAVVRERISRINSDMRKRGERYILIVPGRLGSKNPEWGIFVDYRDVDQAAAIFEYGVDVAGRSEPLPEEGSLTGGIYGSHFLYVLQGGFDEDQKKLATRMYGTQGTHFLTNLMGHNVFYGYVTPQQDAFDPWFFSSPDPETGISILKFPEPVSVYADSLNQRCRVVSEK